MASGGGEKAGGVGAGFSLKVFDKDNFKAYIEVS